MIVQSKTVLWPSLDKCSKSWQWHTIGKRQICLDWSDRLKPLPVQRTAIYAIYVQPKLVNPGRFFNLGPAPRAQSQRTLTVSQIITAAVDLSVYT